MSASAPGLPILLTGGAGFIGSVTAAHLLACGYRVVVYDDLRHGHRDAVPEGAEFVEGDVLDSKRLGELCQARRFAGAIHFAGLIEVGESVQRPAHYWHVNTGGSASTLDALLRAGTSAFVFSSTAAVYGDPRRVPIEEDDDIAPVSPYGASKAAVETLMQEASGAGLRSIALRYFNAAGAPSDGQRGERHEPESHLIPLAFRACRGGRPLTVFGDDWSTPDGTCIRDFIHVDDLARAHVLALSRLLRGEGEGFRAYNLGSGVGCSVRQVLEEVARCVGHPVPHTVGPRRPGDSERLVAAVVRARDELGWTPERSQVSTIVETAWGFEARRPNA